MFVTNSFSGIAAPTLKLFGEHAILAGVLRPLASPDEGVRSNLSRWRVSLRTLLAFAADTMDRSEYLREYRQNYKAHAKRVNLTFGLSEYRVIAHAAKAEGIPLAAFLKRLALQSLEGVGAEAPAELAEQLADLERVIRTIANNVNQMARHSNRIAHVLDEQEVFLHIAALQDELRMAVARAASCATSEEGSDEPPDAGSRS